MKKTFAEYYELSEERIKEIWENSLIVFDTNVLLNLYRYDVNVQEDFINVMKFYKERLWIPYQVGLEFHRNRTETIRNNRDAYNKLRDYLSKELPKVIESLISKGDYTRHPYINLNDIKKKVEHCASSIAKSLEKQENEHPDYIQTDIILNTITELFDGRVGNDFQSADLETLYKEGEKRYANQIPPGYCDEKKKKNEQKRRLYGDLIVWKQTIRHSKTEKRDVIFVTDDYKDDWWDKVEGKHTPRKELIKEFTENTGQDILIYNSSRFLEYAKKNKALKVRQKSIDNLVKFAEEHSRIMARAYDGVLPTELLRSSYETFKEQMNQFGELYKNNIHTLSTPAIFPADIDVVRLMANTYIPNIPQNISVSQYIKDTIVTSQPPFEEKQNNSDTSTKEI